MMRYRSGDRPKPLGYAVEGRVRLQLERVRSVGPRFSDFCVLSRRPLIRNITAE